MEVRATFHIDQQRGIVRVERMDAEGVLQLEYLLGCVKALESFVMGMGVQLTPEGTHDDGEQD